MSYRYTCHDIAEISLNVTLNTNQPTGMVRFTSTINLNINFRNHHEGLLIKPVFCVLLMMNFIVCKISLT